MLLYLKLNRNYLLILQYASSAESNHDPLIKRLIEMNRVKRSPQYDDDYPDYGYDDYGSDLTRCGGRGSIRPVTTNTTTTRAVTTTTTTTTNRNTIPTFPPFDIRVRDQSPDYQQNEAANQGQIVFQ